MTFEPLAVPTEPGAVPGDDARDLLQAVPIGLLVCQDGRIAYANPALRQQLRAREQDLLGAPHDVTAAPEYRAMASAAVARALRGDAVQPGPVQVLRHDGSRFDARATCRSVRFGGRPAVLVALLDTSELSRALGAAEWNAGMLARTESLCRSGSFEIELPSGQLQPSDGLCALLGLDAAAAAAHPVDDLAWVPAAERAAAAS